MNPQWGACPPPPPQILIRSFKVILHNSRFQALNDKERAEWLETITTAILAGLVGGEKAPAPPTKKETTVQVCGGGEGKREGEE